MKLNVKKIACLVISLTMIASAAACKKSDSGDDKESSGVVSAAETVLDAVVKLNTKKINKLTKDFGADEDAVEDLAKIADEHDFVKAVMEKASYEIDEESVKEKKKKSTVEATVTFPAYEDLYYDTDAYLESFIEGVEEQKEKKYESTTVTLEFEVEDDEYTLTNLDAIIDDLYGPMIDVMPWAGVDKPTDPKPTDDPQPTDDPTEPDPTDDPTDPQPTDDPTTTTTASGSGATLKDVTAKKVDLTPDVFSNAVRAVDPSAADGMFNYGEANSVGDYMVNDYYMAYQDDYSVMYTYYDFQKAEDAKAYFDSYTSYLQDYATSYQVEADWGYVAYQSGDYCYGIYHSDNGVISVVSLDASADCVDKVSGFFEGLCH